MGSISVVSLDLDDTLWDLRPTIRRAEQTLREWLSLHHPAVSARFSPEDMFALRPLMLERYPQHRHDVSTLRRMTLRHCFEAVGAPAGAADEAFEVFYVARNQVELFEGAAQALATLAQRYTLLALTNGNADLAQIGLAQHFTHVISAAQVGASKPDAAIFAAAQEACGAAPSQILHVGDHPHADVEGALGAGWRAAWFNREAIAWPEDTPTRRQAGQQHREVRSLEELVTLLTGD